MHDGIIPSGGDPRIRIKNLDIIVDNMRQFYEEQLGHLLLTLPDTTKLGRDPERNVSEAKLLLLLLLGCAVQCSNKEDFITKIKKLNVDTQLAIVDCIKQVTDYQEIVVTQESMENLSLGNVFSKVKNLVKERHVYRNKLKILQETNRSIVDCNLDRDVSGTSIDISSDDSALLVQDGSSGVQSRNTSTPKKIGIGGLGSSPMSNKLERLFGPSTASCREGNVGSNEEAHRYAVELADWKSKVRKQRQELEEKSEALIETREELEHTKNILQKLREENQDLLLEARTAKSYRDELDAAIERAEKADRLETEVARYREKLTDIEYYKSRIEELREDNRVLLETREMLEEQLGAARKRSEKVLELESELIKYEQRFNDLSLERVAERDRCQELCEENAQLQRLIRTVSAEAAQGAAAATLNTDSEPEDNPAEGTGGRLSEQLSDSAQARALKLELENRRLNGLVDSLKEQSLREGTARLLELEKERKRLTLKIDSLSESNERMVQQNRDLETLCKQSLEENNRLQASLASQRSCMDKHQQELQTLQSRFPELERAHEIALNRERQRHEATERRAEEAERNLTNRELELQEVNKNLEDRALELANVKAEFDRECEIARAETQRLREQLESKEVEIDEAGNAIEILEKRMTEFQQEVGDSAAKIQKLREVERSSRELDERAAIDREALESLQSKLETEKQSVRRVSATLERLGLELAVVHELSEDALLEKLSDLPGLESRVLARHRHQGETKQQQDDGSNARVTALQATSEALLADKARLEQQVARLEAQSGSLSSQQAALQLANSRLEADADELASEHAALQRAHNELSHDQKRLQSLHEQLAAEYESLSSEKEGLKVGLRDAKIETRVLRESVEKLESRIKILQAERDSLLANAKSLANLRQEHSKLKEDFRILYTNAEGLKTQYRALQDDYRKAKLDSNKHSLRQTEMQGELSAKDDQLANLELQIGKLSQRCEMLLQMNTGLDNDRRSLMDHVSQLFGQYHELLTLSLEDKEHYHTEEKLYTDKVNHLYRQKEKLEEKIMEHYRNLESCSNKKKSLGASLVRRVRKAGSGLFNRAGRRASWGNTNSNLICDDGSIKSGYEDEEDAEEEQIVVKNGLVNGQQQQQQRRRRRGRHNDDDNDAGDEDDENEEEEEEDEDENDVDDDVDEKNSNDDSRRGSQDPSLEASDALSLAHPGTRRTVYYTDDSTPSLTTRTNQEKRTDTDEPSSHTHHHQTQGETTRPLLIYNKVSAVINDTSTITTTTGNPLTKKNIDESLRNLDKDLLDSSNEKDRKTANSVWYEYGCV